ncbi:hypothetical protein BSF38_05111 [Paludisphaera borealis]|uniref:Uncharacterized protein n=1 Tax=Paludisphaera borealis TaxID=1387353 RepID=A0A1U7CXC3_9BACT|nr:hypothetical protein BSF38_05111 [Paludisphaera borealis]
MRWAMIVNGRVDNIAIWDGVAEWDHGADALIRLDESGYEVVDIGWSWDGTSFAAPVPPDLVPE